MNGIFDNTGLPFDQANAGGGQALESFGTASAGQYNLRALVRDKAGGLNPCAALRRGIFVFISVNLQIVAIHQQKIRAAPETLIDLGIDILSGRSDCNLHFSSVIGMFHAVM
jgi:hypothetical protein